MNNQKSLEELFDDALWVSHSLFDRCKTSGSSANISFRYHDTIYVSASGTCFGRLRKEDFVPLRLDGTLLDQYSAKPSKEYPMHLAFYEKDPSLQSVIHTHAPYSELISCLLCQNVSDVITHYTPYLEMKAGKVIYVPYALPGSRELFELIRERVCLSNAMLLSHHGIVAAGKSVMDAFYILEEIEDSARIMWEMHNTDIVE